MEINLSRFYTSLIIVALIILLGFILGKVKWLSPKTNKDLINLLLMVFMPASLFSAFPSEYSASYLNLFFLGLLGGCVVMLAMILVSKLIYNKKFFKGNLTYEGQFAFIFNNATFLGYPIISTAFGGQGIVAYCGFIIAFNLALFSYGVWLFERKFSWKFLIKTFTNPNIIAVILGMLVFLLRLEVPDIISSTVSYVSAATTPLSLLCIGYMLSTAKLSSLAKNWKLFIIAAIQLTVAPFLAWAITQLLLLPQEVVIVCTLIQALPTATSLGLFAEKYGGNTAESSELVIISTLMSVVTLPIVTILLLGS